MNDLPKNPEFEAEAGAAARAETGAEITASELRQYLQQSVRPSVIPSTFRVVEMEFKRLSEEQGDARLLLEQMMITFRDSHRIVYEKLLELYGGLYLSPDSAGALAQKAPGGELDWGDAESKPPTPDVFQETRAAMRTLSEEDLKNIYSMPTLRPPDVTEKPEDSEVPRIPRQKLMREETPTLPDARKTAELAERIRAEVLFMNEGVSGLSPEDKGLPAQEEDDDPDLHSRITLVEAPPAELIKQSSRPPPPNAEACAEADIFTASERGWIDEGDGKAEADIFTASERGWIDEGDGKVD